MTKLLFLAGNIKALWLFYMKLIVPSLAVSVMLSIIIMAPAEIINGVGISFVFVPAFFHYMIYDLTNPKEYFFYYNLGLTKLNLWSSTIAFSLIIGIILSSI